MQHTKANKKTIKANRHHKTTNVSSGGTRLSNNFNPSSRWVEENEKYAQILEEWEMEKYKNEKQIVEGESLYDWKSLQREVSAPKRVLEPYWTTRDLEVSQMERERSNSQRLGIRGKVENYKQKGGRRIFIPQKQKQRRKQTIFMGADKLKLFKANKLDKR